jgi:hypothetical protein
MNQKSRHEKPSQERIDFVTKQILDFGEYTSHTVAERFAFLRSIMTPEVLETSTDYILLLDMDDVSYKMANAAGSLSPEEMERIKRITQPSKFPAESKP